MAQEKSLLEKYDIPVENLDFKFVKRCENRKRLEQILTILRSGEEGFYPELTAFAENRLREVYPASKLLRTECELVTSDNPKCVEVIDGLRVFKVNSTKLVCIKQLSPFIFRNLSMKQQKKKKTNRTFQRT